MDRYVEQLGPFKFVLIYAAAFSIIINAACFIILSLAFTGLTTLNQIAAYGLMYYFIGLFIARQIVINTK